MTFFDVTVTLLQFFFNKCFDVNVYHKDRYKQNIKGAKMFNSLRAIFWKIYSAELF